MSDLKNSVTVRNGMINGGHYNGPIVRGVQLAAMQSTQPLQWFKTLHWLPYRNDGCKIYACIDPADVDGTGDLEIGSMLTEVMAGEVVMAHNAALMDVDKDPEPVIPEPAEARA